MAISLFLQKLTQLFFYERRVGQTSDSNVSEKPSVPNHDDDENLSKVSKKRKSDSSHHDEDEVVAKQQKETRSGHETDVHLDFEKPERNVSNSELRSSTIEQDDSPNDGISQVEPCDMETSASDDDSDSPLDVDLILAERDEYGEPLIVMENEEAFHDPKSEVKDDFSSFPSYVCFY